MKSLDERLFGAAVLKLSFRLSGEEAGAGFQRIYEGVLRDLKLDDEQVGAYLAAHLEEVTRAVRGKGKRSG